MKPPARSIGVLASLAASAWAGMFAAQSVVSAVLVTAGSATGADTFGTGIAQMARAGDGGLIALLWLAGAAKAVAAAAALAAVRPWGRRLPRNLLVAAMYAIGGATAAYGLADLAATGLIRAGAITLPKGLGSRALAWHLWLWDPYWTLGGVLFLFAASALRGERRREQIRCEANDPSLPLNA